MLAVRWLRRVVAVLVGILAAVALWVLAPTVATAALVVVFAAMVGAGIAGVVVELARRRRR